MSLGSNLSAALRPLVGVLAATALAAPATLPAQTSGARRMPAHRAVPATAHAAAKPRYVGIWEPVSYSEDIGLDAAFFVNRDTGWVAGAGGTILKTTDGGAHWTAQVGGDPRASDPPLRNLRFADATHGWAVAGYGEQLYRTSDGEHWETVGPMPHDGSRLYQDYTFTSPSTGFALAYNHIYATHDGGKTWTPAFACSAKVQANGLTKNTDCQLISLQFPSPRVGFAIGGSRDVPTKVFFARTQDGGATWTLQVVDDLSIEDQFRGPTATLRFVDETHGMFVAPGGRAFATSDGGASWHGSPGTVTSYEVAFADAQVGWTIDDHGRMSYTSDGGNRWLSAGLNFPAYVRGFAFPRRDRAYVVGEHGMVFRYRVVRVEDAPAKAARGPAMPLAAPGDGHDRR